MTSSGPEQPPTPTAVVAANIRARRQELKLSAGDLADRCQALGFRTMSIDIIRNIELRGRQVSVDHLLLFALVLQTSPTELLQPSTPQDQGPEAQEATLHITPHKSITGTASIQRWLTGDTTRDPSTGPKDQANSIDAERLSAIAQQFESQADAFVHDVRQQVYEAFADVQNSITDQSAPDDMRAAISQALDRMRPPTA